MAMKTKADSTLVSDEVSVEMKIDIDEAGTELDACMHIDGEWWVAGEHRHEFCKKLDKLIDEYRI